MRYAARHNKGFTLIELLVVMAISILLMGLVLYPVYQSFVITRQAQAMVDSQDAARTALQMMSREMGQAMYVYDNAQGEAFVPNLKCEDNPNSDYTFAQLIDGVPSIDGVSSTPTVQANVQTPIMLPVAQPGSPDNTTQWFVLPYAKIDFILPKLYMHCNNPDHPDGEPRDYPRDKQTGTATSPQIDQLDWPNCPYCENANPPLVADNIEARPKTPLEQDATVVRYFLALRDNNLGVAPETGAPLNMGWVSPWAKNIIDGTENQVILYRAEFNPHDDTLFPADMPLAQRLNDPFFFYRSAYRQKWINVARVVGIGKYEDLVTATSSASGQVLSVQPTITFRTASIENDTFAPAYENDKMNDSPDTPATVFAGSYGYWTPGSRIEIMRGNYCNDPNLAPNGVDFYTTYKGSDLVVMRRAPGTSNTWDERDDFNITEYEENGYVLPDSAGSNTREMAFTIDANRGTANFALQPPRPTKAAVTGPVCTFDPISINKGFHDQYALDRYGARRNVRVATQALDNITGAVAFPDQYLANSRVVPGSDKIIGPDMIFGPHFGQPVRYERIPLGLRYPAQNQYQIDYDTGWIMFSPDPNLDLPEHAAPIDVYYLIHFNQTDDVVRGDYLTKSLINIHLGMRMFDPDAGKPYPVDLTDSVKIRNAQR